MKPYKPTYFLHQAVHSSEKVNVPSSSTKTSEANRGGLNKIQTELVNFARRSPQDQKDFIASLADPIYQCPSEDMEDPILHDYYSSAQNIFIIP